MLPDKKSCCKIVFLCVEFFLFGYALNIPETNTNYSTNLHAFLVQLDSNQNRKRCIYILIYYIYIYTCFFAWCPLYPSPFASHFDSQGIAITLVWLPGYVSICSPKISPPRRTEVLELPNEERNKKYEKNMVGLPPRKLSTPSTPFDLGKMVMEESRTPHPIQPQQLLPCGCFLK